MKLLQIAKLPRARVDYPSNKQRHYEAKTPCCGISLFVSPGFAVLGVTQANWDQG